MKTYKINGYTNGYIAQRDSNFKGSTTKTLCENLSLQEAQEKLIEFFNEDYDTCYSNWGLIRMNHKFNSTTYKDGTRSYNYDSRTYTIEEMIED